MNSLKKVAGFNILAILLYSVVIRFTAGGENMGILINSAFVVVIHVAITLLVALCCFAAKNNTSGRAWLQSAGIVLLVGFSVCLGNAAI